MQIKTYTGETAEPKQGEAVFYVQSHGFNAGRVLKYPLCNCWEVRTARSFDFEILAIVFESKILQNFIGGSVIPFLRLDDYKKIIAPILKNAVNKDETINNKYLALRNIDEAISNKKILINKLQDLKIALSRETFKRLQNENAHS